MLAERQLNVKVGLPKPKGKLLARYLNTPSSANQGTAASYLLLIVNKIRSTYIFLTCHRELLFLLFGLEMRQSQTAVGSNAFPLPPFIEKRKKREKRRRPLTDVFEVKMVRSA